MVIATVMVVNLFNGMNTSAWTNWVFFAVSIGPILVWLFTVNSANKEGLYDVLKPDLGCLFRHLPWLVLC